MVKWLVVLTAILAAGALALAGCGDSCKPDCTGKECGNDGCGGSCGSCVGDRICDSLGKCNCAVTCGDGNCWAVGTNCTTLGKCANDTQCKACAGTDVPACCDGLYVCCEATHPYACTNRTCYGDPGNCPTALCDALPPNSCN